MIPPDPNAFAGAANRGAFTRLRVLITILFVLCVGLALKSGLDIARAADAFPPWFAPLFVSGVIGIALAALLITCRLWTCRPPPALLRGGRAGLIWTLLVASFVCTSSVHQFHPFRGDTVTRWLGSETGVALPGMLQFNFALTAFGAVAAGGLGILYLTGRRSLSLVCLLIVSSLLLVPNDACPNPFNAPWIDLIGASPLMFIPNALAASFAACALLAVRPALNMTLIAAVCLSTLFLGLGHMGRWIW